MTLKPQKQGNRVGIILNETGGLMVVELLRVESMDHNLGRLLIQAEVKEIFHEVSHVGVQYAVDQVLSQKYDPQEILDNNALSNKRSHFRPISKDKGGKKKKGFK